MFRFLTDLFAAPPARRPAAAVRLSLDAMEARDTPAALVVNPGTTHGFNPQPEPPAGRVGIIAIQPAGDQIPGTGGYLTNPGATHGFNPQPEPPGGQVGIIAIRVG